MKRFLILLVIFSFISGCKTYRDIKVEPYEETSSVKWHEGKKYYDLNVNGIQFEIKEFKHGWSSFRIEIKITNNSRNAITLEAGDFYFLYYEKNGKPYYLQPSDLRIYKRMSVLNTKSEVNPDEFKIEPVIYSTLKHHHRQYHYEDDYFRKTTILVNSQYRGILEFPYSKKVEKMVLKIKLRDKELELPFRIKGQVIYN